MKKNSALSFVKQKARGFLKTTFPVRFFKPVMQPDEVELLKKTTNNSKNLVEYGAGGSTIYFLSQNKRVFSVDNNQPFVHYLQKIKFLRSKISNNKLNLLYIDTGPTREWGLPEGDYKEEWFQYATQVWEELPMGIVIDTVLIDGRFRVLTALYSFLRSDSDASFIIHDFYKRSSYHVLLDFFDVIDSAKQLVIFKKKKITAQKVWEAIERQKQSPDVTL